MLRKQPELIIVFPFTDDDFLEVWDNWKKYREEQFGVKRKYKSPRAEQSALTYLSRISDNNKDIAIKIIMQSMMNTWQGLFKLQENGRKTASNNFYSGGSDPVDRMYSGGGAK